MSKTNTTRVLVISPDVVGKKMAGPGMRYVEVARVLGGEFDTTLAIGIEGSTALDPIEGVKLTSYNHIDQLKTLIDSSDVLFCQMFDRNAATYAIEQGKRIVYDFYNALPVETVGAEKISGFTNPADKDREYIELLRYFRFCCQTGSYFVCSNERQRDWWLGFMMANQGLLPSNLDTREVQDIIGYATFGMEAGEPQQTHHPIKGKLTGKNDFVLLWAGGIWDWFDAITPITAVANLAKQHPDIKLVFYGVVHPNKHVGRPKNVDRSIEHAKKLGVYQKNVIFLEDWVPAGERSNYLLDADVAISSHIESLETRYAFRTRILDHFWTKLPSIVTSGDWFADYISSRNLGIATPCKDIDATEAAILSLYENKQQYKDIVANIETAREDWRWGNTLKDLTNYIRHYDARAPRKLDEITRAESITPPITTTSFLKQTRPVKALKKTPVWGVAKRAYHTVKKR